MFMFFATRVPQPSSSDYLSKGMKTSAGGTVISWLIPKACSIEVLLGGSRFYVGTQIVDTKGVMRSMKLFANTFLHRSDIGKLTMSICTNLLEE